MRMTESRLRSVVRSCLLEMTGNYDDDQRADFGDDFDFGGDLEDNFDYGTDYDREGYDLDVGEDDFGSYDDASISDDSYDKLARVCEENACDPSSQVVRDEDGSFCVVLDGPYIVDEPGSMGAPRGVDSEVYFCLGDDGVEREVYCDRCEVLGTLQDVLSGY